ncbi:hypothetical protein M2137_001534 [Parabacteroides sp. PFB2-10]|nr:hypothetical protein [Parabacteroides sp. PFB2-10]
MTYMFVEIKYLKLPFLEKKGGTIACDGGVV